MGERRFGRLQGGPDSCAPPARSSPIRPDGGEPVPRLELLDAPADVRQRLRSEVAAAEDEVVAVLPGGTVDDVRDALADALARGVTVYAVVVPPTVDASVDALVPGEHVDVLRSWGARPALFLLRDVRGGVLGHPDATEDGGAAGERAVAVDQPLLAGWLYGNAIANVWRSGTQRGLADPPALPATFEHFRSAVTAAALHDLDGTELVVDVEGMELATGSSVSLSGAPVRDVRQSLVEPTNVAFPLENALVVETEDGLVSVGADTAGISAFHEDYAASEVTLRTG